MNESMISNPSHQHNESGRNYINCRNNIIHIHNHENQFYYNVWNKVSEIIPQQLLFYVIARAMLCSTLPLPSGLEGVEFFCTHIPNKKTHQFLSIYGRTLCKLLTGSSDCSDTTLDYQFLNFMETYQQQPSRGSRCRTSFHRRCRRCLRICILHRRARNMSCNHRRPRPGECAVLPWPRCTWERLKPACWPFFCLGFFLFFPSFSCLGFDQLEVWMRVDGGGGRRRWMGGI